MIREGRPIVGRGNVLTLERQIDTVDLIETDSLLYDDSSLLLLSARLADSNLGSLEDSDVPLSFDNVSGTELVLDRQKFVRSSRSRRDQEIDVGLMSCERNRLRRTRGRIGDRPWLRTRQRVISK